MQIFEPEMLQALVAIADTGSFTEAARLLDRSQSTISATIKRFEEAVGFKLVNRTTRTVLLTNDGKEMVRYARQVGELSRQARRRLSQSSHADSVRLGIFPNFDSPLLRVALREFNRLYPDVQVTLHHGRSDILLSRLQEHTLDVICRKLVLIIAWFNLLARFLNGCRVPMETSDKLGNRTTPLG